MFHVPEKDRITLGLMGSSSAMGNNGAFFTRLRNGTKVVIVASDQGGWEHVSVSVPKLPRCPTWEEMCMIKDIFWDEEDCVIQYHPPKKDNISNHPHCLHLWKPVGVALPRPPSIMVGV